MVSTKGRLTDVVRAVIAVIRTGRAIGKIGMRAGPDPVTDVVRAFVAIVRTCGSGRFVVAQAGPGPVACIRVRTIIVRWIPTGRPRRQIWMSANASSVTDVVRTIIAVIRAGGPGGLIVRETCARAVTGIGIGTIVVRRITAVRSSGQIGMRANTR